MPALDKLAQNGITYTPWHTVALCSPTRSTLLTGRNHILNGMAAITEGFEGIASKRANTAYRPGPTNEWVKVKTAAWHAANADRFELMWKH